MDTLEKSRVCRLCGDNCQISIDIFDKKQNHFQKINTILPIVVHKMDFLPKQMCHRCSYKLEEFYNFYNECAKTDSELKNQLSWMSKETTEKQVTIPMVKMNPFKIKTEPPDCNDSDSNEVFGHISSYGSFSSPILTCSRCRCLCNTTVKVSNSPIKVKEMENKKHDFKIKSCKKDSKLNNSGNLNGDRSIDKLKENNFSKDACDLKIKVLEKRIPIVIIDSIDGKSQNFNDVKNRALRPRRSSVNYISSTKKVAHKLKEKFKNKVDIFDSEIVNPVKIKVTSNNSLHPSPIIKLEKVDDTLNNSRARKNLEEFNKRVKELKNARKLDRDGERGNKILQRLENRSEKSFQKGQNKNKKNLQKEEKLKRKSLHLEDFYEKRHFQKLSFSEYEHNSQVLSKEFNCNENNHPTEKSLNIQLNEKWLSNNVSQNGANENGISNEKIRIKQEVLKSKSEKSNDSENSKKLLEHDKTFKLSEFKNGEMSQPLERLPMYPLVKLEKDYSCNVDYPKVKIVRQLTVTDTEKSISGSLDVLSKVEAVSKTEIEKKSSKSKKVSKNLRNKEKKLKNNNGSSKVSKKKKRKQFNLVNVKKVVEDKGTLTISPDLKYFCEECDICFKSRELFQLHPCYQK